MILRSAPASPFGRKVTIAAELLGLAGKITVVNADTMSETDSLRRENPLGKLPTLILDNAETLFDSRVIVAYLDHLAGGMLIPADPGLRFAALKLEALADGICDAAVLQIYEGRWREADKRVASWTAHQSGKVERSLDMLEAEPPSGPTTVGHVALACALGYLDLRFDGAWRNRHARLAAWLADFSAKVPAFETTRAKL